MTTIQKTVHIPANRRLEIDLPEDTPIGGEAEVTITLPPAKKEETGGDDLTPFFGILANNPAFARGGLAIQRELRAEWDREWDHDEDE
ncbi:MAG: hypothetical protein LBS30_07120 [Planctomycetota bacterium]|jgi:hypothetical protein|nr:hypothetical protein [Planctomycetota bacterium]